MPRFPELSNASLAIRESIFARLAAKLAESGGETYPFYLGDTYLSPPAVAIAAAQRAVEEPAHHRYGAPPGERELLDALVEKCRARNRLASDRSCFVVTVGATHALASAVRALLDPGDELLVCAPHWPLIRGITTNAGAIPVEVELSQALYANAMVDIPALLASRLSDRTRAIYFATPNNPDGKVLTREQLESIARFARRHDLWVIADEAYEDFVYAGEHVSIASLHGMGERTVTAFSLSKSYALAGYRLGYLVADPRVIQAVRKVANHTVYNVPAALQQAAVAAIAQGAEWQSGARAVYREARDRASRALRAPHFLAEGGAYLLLDLKAYVPGGITGTDRLHDHLLAGGVAVSPGVQFGARYDRHARLCFTAMPPERLDAGIARLNDLLDCLPQLS